MNPNIRLCLVFHNHQPVGNFDGVFEQAYEDSYRPFLDVFEPFSDLRISIHTSGPLMEWLDEKHPEYIDRLKKLVDQERVEIIGGAFYEPILAMLPSRDRIGQIVHYTKWLEERLNADVRGMWLPERVWEQAMTRDIASAGIRYTILDDFHFKNAGLDDDQLHGHYVTEDDGQVVSIFPGSERLRYLIPFGDPEATIGHLREVAEKHPGAVTVFGDDGEKFGTWPDTKKHVYEDGWLRNFFETLSRNRDWLNVCTLAEAATSVGPIGKIYLPDGSYREMTEWALPVAKQVEYDHLSHELEHDPNWKRIQQFVRGGFWRNFKVKYPETNEMYARMMMVSRRLAQAEAEGVADEHLASARRALYRGQCNCSYWHGAFGGAYLPHLRNAVFNQLIAADNLLDQAFGKSEPFVEATVDDYNFDGLQEVRLATNRLVAWIAPASGGQMYELDVRSICHNLLATLTRRPEGYHEKVLSGPSQANGEVASIHDRVVFKQEGLDQRLQYDDHERKSLVDRFFDEDATVDAVWQGDAAERGDFVTGVYDSVVRRNPDRIQVQLSRNGNAWGVPLKITKGVTTNIGGSTLEIAYLIEGIPEGREFHFGVELNLAGLPAGADDRYFFQSGDQRLGHLGTVQDLQAIRELGLADEWLGMSVRWSANQPTNVWTFPIETVSQSEGGFELVHQSVVVHPHWQIRGDVHGRWSVVMQIECDTSLAESRMGNPKPHAVATS